jgi:hypothetical protein
MVSIEALFSPTLAGEKLSVTVGASGDTSMDAGQAFGEPAADGAVVTAALAVNVTVSVSEFPAVSVTVNVRVPGAGSMVTLEAAAPLTMMLDGAADQAKEATASGAGIEAPVLHPATLALASRMLPAPMVVGSTITATGFCAALTAARASTMPAPH